MSLHKIMLALVVLPLAAAAAAPADPDARAAAVEAQMTDDERFHMLHSHLPLKIEHGKPSKLIPGVPITPGFVRGIPRLNIPDIVETDASLGVVNPFELREGDVATALPSSLALASTFDPALAFETGAMVAGEARAKGFNVLLAPGVNLARDPRNGRNFEYLGEDPLLAGVLGGEASRGIQTRGVVATIKHLAINDQETQRRWLDARIDEAALRESDLLAFQIGIERGQPGSVMCAYNKVNGPYACGSDFLLNQVLKGEWGYPGWVMSDWGAVHEATYFNAGLDQHSGAELDKQVWFDEPLKAEYAAGRVSKARLSDAVRRILRSLYAVGADGALTKSDIDYEANARVARKVAANGIVLLKNDGVLPLAKPKSILVIGGYAVAGVISGGGSSQVTPVGGAAAIVPTSMHWLVKRPQGQLIVPSSPVAALKAALPDAKIEFDTGYDTPFAAARAAHADIAIVFATKFETEGVDSSGLSLPLGQDQLIAAVAKANRNTIVVLETGNPVLMPWLADVNAVVEAWYPGQKGGEAIADVLTGAVNPSGRLPMTFPAADADNPRPQLPGFGEPDGVPIQVEYSEGSDVGYRWFAAQKKTPLFAFGHGLSYTQFKHEALKLSGGDTVAASFKIRNTGEREGADVAQLYLVDAAGTPLRRLAAFERVSLKPGQSKQIALKVDPRLIAEWENGGWHIKGGSYAFALGKSAIELGPTATVKLNERRFTP
jgi:beta-glucosidase